MKRYSVRLAVTFAACLAADLLGAAWLRAFCSGATAAAAALAFVCVFPGMCQGFYSDERCWRKRLGYTLAAGLAGAISTAVVMRWVS